MTQLFLAIYGILFVTLADSVNIRSQRSIRHNSAICNKKPSAFFVVDNSRLDADIITTFDDISEDDCRTICSKNKDNRDLELLCASFTYDPKLFQCSIHSKKSTPDGDETIIGHSGKRYFEKFCIDADLPEECEGTQFIRVQQSVIIGYAKNFSNAATLEECVMQCLKEQFPCRSAMYFYEEGECITNSESALTVPTAFAQEESDKVVYFQNGCEKALQIQESMSGEGEKSREDEASEEIKEKDEKNLEVKKGQIKDEKKQQGNDMGADVTIENVIDENEGESMIDVNGSKRKPVQVEVRKTTKMSDEDINDNSSKLNQKLQWILKTGESEGVENTERSDLEVSDFGGENDNSAIGKKPKRVDILPRKVYNELLEEEKNIIKDVKPQLETTTETATTEFEEVTTTPKNDAISTTEKENPKSSNEESMEMSNEKLANDIERVTQQEHGLVAESDMAKETVLRNASIEGENEDKGMSLSGPTEILNEEKENQKGSQKNLKSKGLEDAKNVLRKYTKLKIEALNETNGFFSEWGPWTKCKMIGERKVRRRRCLDLRKCIGALTDIGVCKPEDVDTTRKNTIATAQSVRTIISPGPNRVQEQLGRFVTENKVPDASAMAIRVTSDSSPDENLDMWSDWEGTCKEFPKVQPCRDHKQIGFESRECLADRPEDCIGPFFRYCTIDC